MSIVHGVSAFEAAFDHLHRRLAAPHSIDTVTHKTDSISTLEVYEQRIEETLEIVEGMKTGLRHDLALIQQRFNQLDPGHPIAKLPPEILSLIFQSVDRFHYGPDGERYREYHFPTTQLSQVSSHWRAVALGTPALWDFVGVRNTPKSFAKMQAWLQRSGSLPVTLHLCCLDRLKGTRLVNVQRIAAVIAPHLHRLEELEFIAHHPRSFDLVGLLAVTATPGTACRLRDVNFKLYHHSENGPTVIPAYDCELFKNVRSVTTYGVHWDGWTTWQAETLEISSYRHHSDSWRDILRPLAAGLPNLRTLNLQILQGLEGVLNVEQHIDLPKLSTLKIHMQDNDMASFFTILDAPLLETVQLQVSATNILQQYIFLPTFAARAPRLRNVSIIKSFTLTSSARLKEMIHLTPSIENLTISGVARDRFYNRDYLDTLPEAIQALPNLKSLRLGKGTFHLESLGRLVRACPGHVEFYLGPCSLYIPNAATDQWEELEPMIIEEFEKCLDIKEWENVCMENGEETGEFEYP